MSVLRSAGHWQPDCPSSLSGGAALGVCSVGERQEPLGWPALFLPWCVLAASRSAGSACSWLLELLGCCDQPLQTGCLNGNAASQF